MTKKRVFKTHVSEIYKDKRGFIKLSLIESQNKFDLAEAIRQREISNEISGGKPYKLLIDTRSSNSVPDKETLEFASSESHKIAEAIIVDDLPMRILAKFYVRLNKLNIVKIFSTEEEAIDWLVAYDEPLKDT